MELFGLTRLVSDLAADDFERLRANFAEHWGPVRLGEVIQRVHIVFKFGFDAGLIYKPTRYGPGFKRPSKRVPRLARAAKGPRMFEPARLHVQLLIGSVRLKVLPSLQRIPSADRVLSGNFLVGGPAMPNITGWPGDQVTRRGLLQVGGLGMLGLSLPQYLSARDSLRNQKSRRRREPSCIFIVQYGGASHIDTWDPKPDAPDGMRGPYKPIATSITGLGFGELLPRLARLAHRCCLIRSMSHGNGDHDGGMHVCLTGHSRPLEGTPCLGSVTSRLRPARASLPSYVWLQNLDADVRPWYLTGGSLGPAHAPLLVGRGADNASAPDFRLNTFDPPPDVALRRLSERQQLLARVEQASASQTSNTRVAEAMQRCQERALELVTGPEARRAFDLRHEPGRVRERYGRHPLGQNLLLARRLIEAGVRLVSVNAWAGVPNEGEGFIYSKSFTQGWDHHGAEVQKCGIFSTGQFGLGLVLPRFDQALSALLEDLNDRGLLEETLVVVVGEFGRTPKITSNPHPGRDHWPACYSALLAGAGVKAGLVYGASDRIGAYVKDAPVSPENFAATLLHALGVSSQTRLSPDGATQPASTGQPITGLFG